MASSTRCPGAAVLALLIGIAAPEAWSQTRPPPLAEADRSGVGYETVAAALAGVRSRPGVVLSTENGWLIATEEAAYTIWSFAPPGNAAYPAVVRRQVRAEGAGSVIEMTVRCEASKEACDDLVRTFAEMSGLPLPG